MTTYDDLRRPRTPWPDHSNFSECTLQGQVVVRIAEEFVSQRLFLDGARKVADIRRDLELEQLSRLELRTQLLDSGWSVADVNNPADVATRRLFRHRPQKYFICLLHPHIDYIPGFHDRSRFGICLCLGRVCNDLFLFELASSF